MEFYIVALIFIACMIALALLIYYCQEYRNNQKYSFSGQQKDISSIALAIGVPGFNPSQFANSKSAGTVQFNLSPQVIQPNSQIPSYGNQDEIQLNVLPYPTKLPLSSSPPPPPPPSLQGSKRPSLVDDEFSDSGSSSSSKIYFPPNSAAYSIAKRISFSANAEASRKSLQSVLSAQAAAYFLAKRMKEKQNILNSQNNTKSISPSNSENTIRSESYNVEMRNGRSASPYLPLSVLKYHTERSRNSRSPLRNHIFFLEGNEKRKRFNYRTSFICSSSDSDSDCNSSYFQTPSKQRNVNVFGGTKQNKNTNHLEQKELAPPQCSENISYPKQNPIFTHKSKDDRLPLSETCHPCSSVTIPLRTVEEEE